MRTLISDHSPIAEGRKRYTCHVWGRRSTWRIGRRPVPSCTELSPSEQPAAVRPHGTAPGVPNRTGEGPGESIGLRGIPPGTSMNYRTCSYAYAKLLYYTQTRAGERRGGRCQVLWSRRPLRRMLARSSSDGSWILPIHVWSMGYRSRCRLWNCHEPWCTRSLAFLWMRGVTADFVRIRPKGEMCYRHRSSTPVCRTLPRKYGPPGSSRCGHRRNSPRPASGHSPLSRRRASYVDTGGGVRGRRRLGLPCGLC